MQFIYLCVCQTAEKSHSRGRFMVFKFKRGGSGRSVLAGFSASRFTNSALFFLNRPVFNPNPNFQGWVSIKWKASPDSIALNLTSPSASVSPAVSNWPPNWRHFPEAVLHRCLTPICFNLNRSGRTSGGNTVRSPKTLSPDPEDVVINHTFSSLPF